MNTDQEQGFIKSARSALDASANALDAHTLSRLHSARSRAVEAAGQQPSWRTPGWLLPAGALASTALVLVVSSVLWMSNPLNNHAVSTPEEGEIVVSDENLEIATDYDFYHWLDEQTAMQAET
ncbi:MAG: hypothetical protein Q7U07_08340 [Gammaproteobacteria bacterium]|nr:hypothetical protein [Gammaproteobacteria bacterium]